MHKTFLLNLAAVAATVLTAPSAHALLIGNTVSYDYRFPSQSTPVPGTTDGNYLVGAGVEISGLANPGDFARIDLSDTNILVDFISGGTFVSSSFNGAHFADAFGTIAAFTSVTVSAATNLGGFNASRISFDANNIFLNFTGLTFSANSIVSVNVAGAPSTKVPEPGTLTLLGLGALAAGALRRRRAS